MSGAEYDGVDGSHLVPRPCNVLSSPSLDVSQIEQWTSLDGASPSSTSAAVTGNAFVPITLEWSHNGAATDGSLILQMEGETVGREVLFPADYTGDSLDLNPFLL